MRSAIRAATLLALSAGSASATSFPGTPDPMPQQITMDLKIPVFDALHYDLFQDLSADFQVAAPDALRTTLQPSS